MTITSPLTPSQEAESPVDAAGSNIETEPGTIDVSWLDNALRDARRPRPMAVREAARRRPWWKILVAVVVLCACGAIGAIVNAAGPGPRGQANEHRAAPSAVHRVPESAGPAYPSSSAFVSCPFSLLSHTAARGGTANSLDPLSCTDTWPALTPVSPPAGTQTPHPRRPR